MEQILTHWSTVIAPSLATILISIAYVPQIVKTYRTKKVDDLSLGFWILINSFLVCMVSNASYLLITANGVGYFVTEIINFVLALTVLSQILYYRKQTIKK
jgi:MtN3 and saliva related transmembrane protein